jgi:hypothetical protein
VVFRFLRIFLIQRKRYLDPSAGGLLVPEVSCQVIVSITGSIPSAGGLLVTEVSSQIIVSITGSIPSAGGLLVPEVRSQVIVSTLTLVVR